MDNIKARSKANHDLINQIMKLKTIQDLIKKDDLPLPKDQVFKEIEKSLQDIKNLYSVLLS